MLQIITEKFYPPGERYETLHRGIFYTNYRLLREEKLETSVGVLRPATGFDGLAALTCEILEKIEKHPDGNKPGVMISTGGDTLLNDFAAVVSFVLNITCAPDPNLVRRLLSTQRPSLGVEEVPCQQAPLEIAQNVREAVLANEHVAAARRFTDFALAHVAPSFFREETKDARGAIGKTDLAFALQQAYSIRSGYVHTLKEVPRPLTVRGLAEAMEIEGKPTLTLAGLSQVARHIIMQFVERGELVEHEQFDYRGSFPNVVTLPLAPEYWIHQTDGFTFEHGPSRLTAFLGQWTAAVLLRQPNAKVTDIRPLLIKIEEIVPGLSKASQRVPLLAIYFLFDRLIPREERLAKFEEMSRFAADFDDPSIESFVAHILTEQKPGWTLEQFEQLHDAYFKSSRATNSTRIGSVLEAAFSLYVAELNRAAGNEAHARELIAFAVESCPAHAALRAFEAPLTDKALPDICWYKILLPPLPLGALENAASAT